MIIEKPILQLLHIGAETPLEITTDGTHLIVSPAQDEKRAKSFKAALVKINRRHAKTLRTLAK